MFHLRLPNIETNYEGQRTDGLHAVNGTANSRAREDTIQCLSDSICTTIDQIIAN
jgi:hypothetical protein